MFNVQFLLMLFILEFFSGRNKVKGEEFMLFQNLRKLKSEMSVVLIFSAPLLRHPKIKIYCLSPKWRPKKKEKQCGKKNIHWCLVVVQLQNIFKNIWINWTTFSRNSTEFICSVYMSAEKKWNNLAVCLLELYDCKIISTYYTEQIKTVTKETNHAAMLDFEGHSWWETSAVFIEDSPLCWHFY